jgi:hypothetical protein
LGQLLNIGKKKSKNGLKASDKTSMKFLPIWHTLTSVVNLTSANFKVRVVTQKCTTNTANIYIVVGGEFDMFIF